MYLNFDPKNFNLPKLGLSALAAAGICALGVYAGRYITRTPAQETDHINPIVDRAFSENQALEAPILPNNPAASADTYHIPQSIAASSSGSNSTDNPIRAKKSKKGNLFSSEVSKNLEGLDLAGRVKVLRRPNKIRWLDLANSSSEDTNSDLSFEMPIRRPVLANRRNPQRNNVLSNERLLTKNPLEQVTLATNVFNIVPLLLGYGPGRPNNYKKHYQIVKNLHNTNPQMTCSSSSHAPTSASSQTSNAMIPENQDLMDMYIDSLNELLVACDGVSLEIEREEKNAETSALFHQLRKVKKTLIHVLKQKIHDDINVDYLFNVIRRVGDKHARVLLANLGLTDDLINLVLQAYQSQGSASLEVRTFDQKFAHFQEALKDLIVSMGEVPKKSILNEFSENLSKELTKAQRGQLIEQFKNQLPTITSIDEVNEVIAHYGLENELLFALCKGITKSPNRYNVKNFTEKLKEDYIYAINFLLRAKFVNYNYKLTGLPSIPNQILELLYQSGFVDSDLEGYFDIPAQGNTSDLHYDTNLISEEDLSRIRELAHNTLENVLKEQRKHSSARFGDLTRFYRNFVVRANLIADALKGQEGNSEELLNHINAVITSHLQSSKHKNAHRLYQGNNQISPGIIQAIKNEIITFSAPLRNHQAEPSVELPPSLNSEGNHDKKALLTIKRILASQENKFIVAVSDDILAYLNNPDIYKQTLIEFKDAIKRNIFDKITSISQVKVDDQFIVSNWEILIPEKSRQLIQHIVEKLQIKQKGIRDDINDFFTQEDRTTSARLSLLSGSPEDTAYTFNIMNDRQFYAENPLENCMQRAHTQPYPLQFFPSSIPLTILPIDEKLYKRYLGHTSEDPSFKRTQHLNNAFLLELKERNGQISERINKAINLSFAISQLEFSEVYLLPKFINSEIDSISEFREYGEILKGVLIECVNMQENPTKLAIYKKLNPYIKEVLRNINLSIAEKKDVRKLDNNQMLKMIMICNVLQSIIVTKPVRKTAN